MIRTWVQRRAFADPFELVNWCMFLVVAIVLVPVIRHFGWKWTAVPIAAVSLTLGFITIREARDGGWKAALPLAGFVLAVTAGIVALILQ